MAYHQGSQDDTYPHLLSPSRLIPLYLQPYYIQLRELCPLPSPLHSTCSIAGKRYCRHRKMPLNIPHASVYLCICRTLGRWYRWNSPSCPGSQDSPRFRHPRSYILVIDAAGIATREETKNQSLNNLHLAKSQTSHSIPLPLPRTPHVFLFSNSLPPKKEIPCPLLPYLPCLCSPSLFG